MAIALITTPEARAATLVFSDPPGKPIRLVFRYQESLRVMCWLAVGKDGSLYLNPRLATRRSPIKRTKRRGLLRNVCVALGNIGDPQAIPALISALHDEEALVRGHAGWALGRIGGEEALNALKEALDREEDVEVQQEIRCALATEALSRSV